MENHGAGRDGKGSEGNFRFLRMRTLAVRGDNDLPKVGADRQGPSPDSGARHLAPCSFLSVTTSATNCAEENTDEHTHRCPHPGQPELFFINKSTYSFFFLFYM